MIPPVKSRARGLIELLKPYAKPRWKALLAVFFLSSLGAFLQQGTYLLLPPTWTLLFPSEEQALAEVQGQVFEEQGLSGVEDQIQVALTEAEARYAESKLGDGWASRTKRAVTNAILGEETELTNERRMGLLWKVAAVISAVALLAAIAGYFASMLAARVSLSMVVALREDLARHLVNLPMRYHGERKFGDLLSRMSADVGMTLSVVNLALRDLIQEPLMALMALGMAAFVSWQATLMVLIGLPLLLVPVSLLMRLVSKGSTKSLSTLGETTQVLSQIFSGIRTVKAYRAEEREIERYSEANRSYVKATMGMVRANAFAASWTVLYTHMGLGIVVLVVGWLMTKNTSMAGGGEMLTFFLLISRAYSSMKRTTKGLGKVAQAQGAYSRLQALLDERCDVEDDSNAVAISGLGSGVKFTDVSFDYGAGDGPALKSINLEVRPGETLALVGPSGSGKSTLMDLVARFMDPTLGSIAVDGKDLRGVSLDSWTQQFSMVTQSPFLFHTTVGENIRYGKPGASEEEVSSAARAADIDEFLRSLPDGYDTDVKDAGMRLSGGQRQRITIARAVLHGAPLLLLDEATSALDTESERAVQVALDRLLEGHTAIVIAHRLSTIREADRIAVLEAGELVELGTHDELLALNGTYSRLHAMQFRDEE
ncbi:MAG: subfamily B ATP-binding cassette protein MsbA [Planctomycetota bacterium]|jgi:subfamily B ATP-binding cassette protein MsbA